MNLKPISAVILGFAIGISLCLLIGWLAPFNRGTHWRDIVIEIQQDNMRMQRELEEYRIDDAERRVHDMRTWGDTIWMADSIEDSLNLQGK